METFLVRVWTMDGEKQPEGVRGTAVHLRSGLSMTYTEPGALIDFLTDAAAAGDGDRHLTLVGDEEEGELQ